jgi:hypothetical protein
VTPRSRRDDAAEPLFGEDWWVTDQQLFQDAVNREAGRKPRRWATIRKRKTAAAGYEQDRTRMHGGFGLLVLA